MNILRHDPEIEADYERLYAMQEWMLVNAGSARHEVVRRGVQGVPQVAGEAPVKILRVDPDAQDDYRLYRNLVGRIFGSTGTRREEIVLKKQELEAKYLDRGTEIWRW